MAELVKNLPAMRETWVLRSLLGLEKKTVSKALAESSNFGENKTEL